MCVFVCGGMNYPDEGIEQKLVKNRKYSTLSELSALIILMNVLSNIYQTIASCYYWGMIQ